MKIGEVWQYFDQGDGDFHTIVLIKNAGQYACQQNKPDLLSDIWEYKILFIGTKLAENYSGTGKINGDYLYEEGRKIANSERSLREN